MKRVVSAVSLLAVAVAVTVWTGYVFEREMNKFEKELNVLVDASDGSTEKMLIEKAEKVVSQWNNSSGLLRSVALHDGIDELSRDIMSLPQTIKYSGKDEMKLKCIEAINLIKTLKICEKISFENIL